MQQCENLKTKQNELLFNYNEDTSSYQAKFQLTNISQQKQYFRYTSTFGFYLKQINNSRIIEGGQNLILSFKIQQTNQISKHEKIIITYSNQKISSQIVLDQDSKIQLKMLFNIEIIDNQIIDMMLKEQAEIIHNESYQLFYDNNIKLAMDKFQQSFQLYRPYVDSIFGMALCAIELDNLQDALRFVETALICQEKDQYCIQKLWIIISKIRKQSLFSIFLLKDCLKLRKIVSKKIYETYKYQKQINNFFQQSLKIHFSDYLSLQMNIKLQTYKLKCYHDKKQFKSDIQQILSIKESNQLQQTPEYILDPIGYEIFQKPMILPSGISYEYHHIIVWLKKQNYTEPLSRMKILPEQVIENINLSLFIKNHTSLAKWKKFELQTLMFSVLKTKQ